MFAGFEERFHEASGARIRYRIGGAGPPVLLLHGNPQTSAIWRHVAPALMDRWTVVCPDLRGYGFSSKPPSGPEFINYSKREMARDQIELMAALGFDRFAVCGHDRGGRVAHRMAFDWPEQVSRICVLDIAPTREMYQEGGSAFGAAYWHWYFMLAPPPLPERMISADPDFYWLSKCSKQGGDDHVFGEALEEYLQAFRDPETVRASCDDYRASAGIDITHDDAEGDRKLNQPLLCLWGGKGRINQFFDPVALWRRRAHDVSGRAIDCAHYMPEEAPAEVTAALIGFLEQAP